MNNYRFLFVFFLQFITFYLINVGFFFNSTFPVIEFKVCFVVYAIATVFQLYNGSDMMYEMRRRKLEPTLLPTQEILNLPHHKGMV